MTLKNHCDTVISSKGWKEFHCIIWYEWWPGPCFFPYPVPSENGESGIVHTSCAWHLPTLPAGHGPPAATHLVLVWKDLACSLSCTDGPSQATTPTSRHSTLIHCPLCSPWKPSPACISLSLTSQVKILGMETFFSQHPSHFQLEVAGEKRWQQLLRLSQALS